MKMLEDNSVLRDDFSYSSYWSKWINSYDFKNSGENLEKIYGDYFTSVRWIPKNYLLRFFVGIEIFVTNFFSSPRFFLSSLFKSSYWRLRSISQKQGRFMNHANIVALLAFNFVCSRLKPNDQTICVIGDGATNFVSLCFSSKKSFKKIFSVNLPEVHLVETEMLIRAGLGEDEIMVLAEDKSLEDFFSAKQRIGILPAQKAKILKGLNIDVFVNISSMQEMTTEAINSYFDVIKGTNSFFYCCNRKEKVLPDGSVSRFDQYPWGTPKFLIYEKCPWMKKTVNLTRPIIRRQEPHLHVLASYRE